MRIALILVPTILAALSLTSAFQSPTKPTDRPASVAKAAWPEAVAAIMTPDLNAVVVFCLVGLLLALNLILRFPDFGAVMEQCDQF
ncbi:MAG: hypothetical protein WB774_12370 [Xanthobacteraceae bacterium]|jgi:hypothetical protein